MWKRIVMAVLGMSALCSEAADARLQAVLQRLDAGQAVTLVTIGGSITTGYAADPPRERGWAAQLAHALQQRGALRFINAGVSGTDSAAAAQRLQAHVLDAQPDLVIVEFGVNDHWLDPQVRAASYEGLLRRLLTAPKPPAVLVLALTQQGNRERDAVELQLKLAAHYGLTALDFGQWMQQRVDAGIERWEALYGNEPVHPNERGHAAIAQALLQTLQAVRQAPAASAPPPTLPAALHGHDFEFVHTFAGPQLEPWRHHGFVRGGEVHPEWAALPGGQASGWTTTANDAEAAFLVWGRQVALFHAESEHYRNLEARVDDGPWVPVIGHVPERRGYLGWHYTPIGRDLEPGAHLLVVRMRRDALRGSGRSASFIAVMSAGLLPPALRDGEAAVFQPAPRLDAQPGWQLMPAIDRKLRYVGRFDTTQPGAPLMAWSGSEIRANFSGTRLALRLEAARNASWFTVEIDGHAHVLALHGEGVHDWLYREPLAPGEHTLRIVKRTEGSMSEARFIGLLLDAGGKLLPPPAARPLRLEFYGDSITAGACNGILGEDNYDDLYAHDGTRAYGALAAKRLGADYVGIAVSGIGITRTWDTLLMPQVWDRTAPRLDAPQAPVGERAPDVVLVNLGQNDHGFPASRGEPFPGDFSPRYLAFVRGLRQRYPQAKLVLLTGGMTAWKEQPAIGQTLADTAARLRAEGDRRVWTYRFEAFSYAHPRIDVHAQMADELVDFLRHEVLP